jgi:hypothetical protein
MSVDDRSLITLTLPLYRHVEEQGLRIILHPASRSLPAASGVDEVTEVGIGWMFDTSAAALALITSGTLEACPNLRIVHPHLGGVIPFIDGRLDVTVPLWATRPPAHPLHHYLRTYFYIDSVSQTPARSPWRSNAMAPSEFSSRPTTNGSRARTHDPMSNATLAKRMQRRSSSTISSPSSTSPSKAKDPR